MSAIKGTKLCIPNCTILTSTGLPSLDEIVGGGMPVGSTVLIEEDALGTYSKLMLSLFVAEGVVNKHSVFIASKDIDPTSLISNLPMPNSCIIENNELQKDKMKIAWRYNNLNINENRPTKHLGHNYDLSQKMHKDQIEACDVTCWDGGMYADTTEINTLDSYDDLLNKIDCKLEKDGFRSESTNNILRIGIHLVGTPLWSLHSSNEFNKWQLANFFYKLRLLMRTAFSIAFVSVPSKFLEEEVLWKCIHCCDFAFKFEPFTDTEKNRPMSEFQGLFQLKKLAAVNCLESKLMEARDYGFKLKRRKFTIECLHLPPGQEELNDQKNKKPACRSSASTFALEF